MLPHDVLARAHEKVGAAVRALMIPTDPRSAVPEAMRHLLLAFHDVPPPLEARPLVARIEALMAGSGGWEERAARLRQRELERLSETFWHLYAVTTRLYYLGLVHRGGIGDREIIDLRRPRSVPGMPGTPGAPGGAAPTRRPPDPLP
jgi:hypothetical protein